MKKRILGIVLSLAMVAAAVISPMTSNASEAVDITKYRSQEGHTTPTDIAPSTDVVFAGWYTDATYKTPIAEDKLDGTAVPKWVDADVLTVKYQLTNGLTVNDSETALRLVTTVDSLAYKQVGFVLNNGTKDSAPAMSDTVYSQLSGGGKLYDPDTTFCASSEFFAVYEISGMPNSEFTTDFTVTPQWETLDGTIVKGETCDAFSVGSTLKQNITRISEAGDATIYNYSGIQQLIYRPDVAYANGSEVSFDFKVEPAQYYYTMHVYGETTNTEYVANPYYNTSNGTVSFDMEAEEKVRIMITFQEKTADGSNNNTDWSANVVTLSNFQVVEPQVVVGADGSVTLKNAANAKQLTYRPGVAYANGSKVSFDFKVEPAQYYYTVHVYGETTNTEYVAVGKKNTPSGSASFTMKAEEKVRILITYNEKTGVDGTGPSNTDWSANVVTLSNFQVVKALDFSAGVDFEDVTATYPFTKMDTDANRVDTMEYVSYPSTIIGTATTYGVRGLKLTSASLQYPGFIANFDKEYAAGSKLSFDLYIQSSDAAATGLYAMQVNAGNGVLGKDAYSSGRTSAYNTWNHVEVELNAATTSVKIYPNLINTEFTDKSVIIYVDNVKVVETADN